MDTENQPPHIGSRPSWDSTTNTGETANKIQRERIWHVSSRIHGATNYSQLKNGRLFKPVSEASIFWKRAWKNREGRRRTQKTTVAFLNESTLGFIPVHTTRMIAWQWTAFEKICGNALPDWNSNRTWKPVWKTLRKRNPKVWFAKRCLRKNNQSLLKQ